MSAEARGAMRPHVRSPLPTPEQALAEPAPFPMATSATPLESSFTDWRKRLGRNLSRGSDKRWEPLTWVHATPDGK